MMHQFHNFTGWGEALCMLMVLAYFTIYFLENLLPMFPQIYLIYDTTFLQPAVWAALGIVALQASALELFWSRMSLFKKVENTGFHDINHDQEESNKLIGKGGKAGGPRQQELASLGYNGGRQASNVGLMGAANQERTSQAANGKKPSSPDAEWVV